MAGRGAPPKDPAVRVSRKKPVHEWQPTVEVGWQHGRVPTAPAGLMPASKVAWTTWFKAWFAAHWGPEDLPGLRQVIRLHDQVERGEFQRAGELRLAMDTYGITPKGQQDRRWQKPKPEEEGEKPKRSRAASKYAHLRAVPG